MPQKRSIPQTLFFNMVLVTVIATAAVGSLWILREYSHFNQAAALIHETQVEARKALMKAQVDQVAGFIQFKRQQAESRMHSTLKGRVLEAQAVAARLYEQYYQSMSAPEVGQLIKESLRAMGHVEGGVCYFALDGEGTLQVSTEHPELEGSNELASVEPSRSTTARELLRIGREQGEGYYSEGGEPTGSGPPPRTSYVVRFGPLDWVIGSAELHADVEEALKKEALEWIDTIRFGDGYYIFVGQWDGLSLSGPAKGQNMLDVTDPNGVKIVQALIQCAQSGGGFISYVMPRFEGLRPAPKLSYAQRVEGWNWYVGTGVYVDDIEQSVAAYRAERRTELQVSIAVIFILLVLLCLGLSVFVARMAKTTRAAFDGFTGFFQRVSLGEEPSEVQGTGYSEFDELAVSANRMLQSRHEAESALRQSEERLHILFARAADAMYVSDMTGRLVQVNQQACEATGYSEEELLSMNVNDLDVETPSPEGLQEFFESLASDRPSVLDSRHRRKDGSTFPVEITVALLDTPGGPLVFGIARDVSERSNRQLEYAQIIHTALDGLWVADRSGKLLDVNPAACMMLGYTREELLRLSVREIDAQLSSEEIEARLHQILMDRFAIFSTRHRRNDGMLIDVEISASYLPIGEGRVITFIRDISERHRAEEERRRLEAQLQQAQKMEAVGQLTGGVAHDFNNLLQVINAGTDLALADLASDHPARPVLLEVTQAGGRAADLVRQLLVFSRRQIMRPEALDLNAVVEEVLRLIQRIIGEHIQLIWLPGAEVGTVCADRGMVEQTLMNLCVNGRDAMADSGVLSVSTQPVFIDADFCNEHPWAEPGSYVRLGVQDTGCGMDSQTMSHIFEPFYSTKEEGKGSGLGLSTVYGIIKQHRGLIHATSSPGSGALFEVYWPVSEGPVTISVPATATECRGGIETILVAEDDEVVRSLSHRILTAGGYTVLVASDGEEAVRLFEAHQSEIDLVLLDAVMPRMGGREAYDRMRSMRPGIKALFASGYSESAIHRNFVLEAGLELLQKPYTREPLLRTVRSVLDRQSGAGSG